jgi:hypothetical protein
MSHHLDSELARRDGRLDITDQYLFRGRGGTVFVMNVNSSLAGPDATAGFHPEGRYEFKIHRGGADTEDLTYRLTFGPADGSGEQDVSLWALTGPEAADDTAEGALLAQGRTHDVIKGADGLRLWAGRALDPFYVDLTQVRAINTAVGNGTELRIPGWSPESAKSDFAGSTVHSIVLEVSDDDPRLGAGQDIGVWSVTKLATDTGGWRQINREGHPMMWPIFRPDDSRYASDSNTVRPHDEVEGERAHISQLVSAFAAANRTAEDPMAHGAAVARILLPDLLPYRTGTIANFGFLDKNGRNLADNAPEVMFSLVLNSATSTGLTADQFADTRRADFPYVAEQPATAR